MVVFARYMNLLDRTVAMSEKRTDQLYEKACARISSIYEEVVVRNRQNDSHRNLGQHPVWELKRFTKQCRPHKIISRHWRTARLPYGVFWLFRHLECHAERVTILETRSENKMKLINTPHIRRVVPLADLPQLIAFS